MADERRVPFGHALSAHRHGIGVLPGVAIDGLAEGTARRQRDVAVCLHLVGSGASGVLVFLRQNANGILLNRENEILCAAKSFVAIAAGWQGAIVAPGGTGVSQ